MYDVAEEDLFARKCSTAVEGGGLFGSRDGMMHRGRICVVVDLGARMLLHIGFFFPFLSEFFLFIFFGPPAPFFGGPILEPYSAIGSCQVG